MELDTAHAVSGHCRNPGGVLKNSWNEAIATQVKINCSHFIALTLSRRIQTEIHKLTWYPMKMMSCKQTARSSIYRLIQYTALLQEFDSSKE